ncbi:MAG: methyltransferase domain-containing protein [Bacteroidetes bacterium]|nr:methyltransferase domain-containing protein [Bacteroidota bacterium]
MSEKKDWSPFDLNDPGLINILDEVSLWSAPFGKMLLEMVPVRKGMMVLDIGCGTGFPILELAMRLGKSSYLIGIDPWQAALDRTKTKATGYGIKNLTLIKGVAEKLPFPDNHFSLIVSNNGLNNADNLEKAIQECARTCQPGGSLVFTFNTSGTMMELYRIIEDVLDKRELRKQILAMFDHIAEKRKPVSEYVKLLKINGFAIDETRKDSFSYRFADADAFVNHYFIRLAFLDTWKKLLPDKIRKTAFQEILELLDELAEAEHEITLTVPFVGIKAIKD